MNSRRLAIGAAVFVLAAASIAQEVTHAPTLQSCVGDINLWSSQMPGLPEPSFDQIRSGTKSLTLHEIDGRIGSLGDCVNAYPALGKGTSGNLAAAVSLGWYYGDEEQARYFDFLVRHAMMNKFKEEDDAGRR